jgi:hypothetical protein
MNVDIPDAALWGAAGGFVSSVVVLLLGRALRHRGKIRANFSDWYFEFRAEERVFTHVFGHSRWRAGRTSPSTDR